MYESIQTVSNVYRERYAGNFVTVWGTVLVTLTEEGGGPAMCGYTERLRLQLVLLLCQLVVVHLEEDLPELIRHLPHIRQVTLFSIKQTFDHACSFLRKVNITRDLSSAKLLSRVNTLLSAARSTDNAVQRGKYC